MPQPPADPAPMVDTGGRCTPVWRRFFAALSGSADAAQVIAPTGSPFAYTAPVAGAVAITGGTVTALVLTRARVDVPLPPATAIMPVAAGDIVNFAFSGTPTLTFLPS